MQPVNNQPPGYDPNQQALQPQVQQQGPPPQGSPLAAPLQPAIIPIKEAAEVASEAPGIEQKVAFAKFVVASAKNVVEPYIAQVTQMDYTLYTPEQLTQVDTALADLQGRIIAGTKRIDESYLPMSRAFTAIVSMFTAEKKNLEKLKDLVQFPRLKIAGEISSRANKAKVDADKKLSIDKENIDFTTQSAQHILTCMFAVINETKKKALNAYFTLQGNDFELFVKNLTSLNPHTALTDDTINAWATTFQFGFHHTERRKPEVNYAELKQAVGNHVKPYLDWMIGLIPMRRAQLAAGAPDNSKWAEWLAQIDGTTAVSATQAVEQVQQVADAQKTNATYAVQSTVQVPQQTSGTVEKKVFKPTTPKHWADVIMNYVERQVPHLSDAELQKKFGFILTWTNTVLKATGELSPLLTTVPLEDEIKPRAAAYKPKKEEGK
jgi:hypothetical protein